MAADEVTVRAELEGNAAKGLKQIEDQADRTRRSLSRLTREKAAGTFERLDKVTERWAKRLQTAQSGPLGRFGDWLRHGLARGTEVAAKGLAALAAGTTFFALKAATSFEQTRIALDGFLGSAAAGGKMFAGLQKLNLQTPFELSSVSAGARQLLGFGFAGEQILPVMKAVTDAAAGLGAGEEGLQRILLNLGQVRSQGVVTGRELRDFATIGFPGYELVASILGKTREEIRAMGDDAQVSGDDFINAVIGMQGPLQRFSGMAEKQMGSLLGLWSNLKDAVQVKLADASGPLVESLKTAMPALTALISTGIDTIAPPLITLATGLVNLLLKSLPAAAPVLAALADGVSTLLGAMGPALGAFAPFTDELAKSISLLVAELVPVMPDLVRALVAVAEVLPVMVVMLASMAPLVGGMARLVSLLLEIGPVRDAIAATLLVLLGFKALTGLATAANGFAGGLFNIARGQAAVAATSGAGGAGGATGAAVGGMGKFGRAAAGVSAGVALTQLAESGDGQPSLLADVGAVLGKGVTGGAAGSVAGPWGAAAGAAAGVGKGLWDVVRRPKSRSEDPARAMAPSTGSASRSVNGSYNTTKHDNFITIQTNDPATMDMQLRQFFNERDERGVGVTAAP